MSRIQGTVAESKERVAAAGVRSWPVVINVNRTDKAIGVVTAHHHAAGTLGAYTSVGAPVQIADQWIDTTDGAIRVGGVASAVLDVFERVNLRKVA